MPDPAAPTSPRADAEWSRAFAELAHDVRSAGGGVQISLDVLALARSEAEREKAMALLRSSLQHMTRLAEDLGDIASLLAGAAGTAGVPHDLLLATRRACDRLAAEAALRQVDLAFETNGIASHPVTGDPGAWDRNLERLIKTGLQGASRSERFVVTLNARLAGTDLVVPCGPLELPAEEALGAAWAAPRDKGRLFARGLWLARAFLIAEGGGLAVREVDGRAALVASLPASQA